MCTSFCMDMFSFLLGLYLGVEFLGHMVTLHLIISGVARPFFSFCTILHSHLQCMRAPIAQQHNIAILITLPSVIVSLAHYSFIPNHFFVVFLVNILHIYCISICNRPNNMLYAYYFIQLL